MTTRVLAGLTASLVIVPLLWAQTPINELPGSGDATVSGEVTGVWGNRFALEDETGSILVEAGPTWYHDLGISEGEHLRVTGEVDGETLSAIEIERGDGEVVQVRPAEGRVPWAGAQVPETRRRAAPDDAEPPAREHVAPSAGPGMTLEQFDDVLAAALEYGFVQFDEIELEGPNKVEVEGWLEDGWEAEVEFTLTDFRLISEKRKRDSGQARGMSADQVREAVARAQAEGIYTIDEVELDNGAIEVEGWDRHGRELEVKLDRRTLRVIEVEYD